MELSDVLIVGAGPAGSAAALAALRERPGARVTLLDAHTFPRDKACGDGIAPHVFADLEDLGVHGLTRGYGPVAVLDLRTPGGVGLLARPPRASHVIPRLVFDHRLVEAAQQAGAELIRHRVRRIDAEPGRVVVDGRFAGRTLIAADGANSLVRRSLGLARNPDQHLAVAVRGYAPDGLPDGAEPVQLIAMQAQAWPAYAWSFPLADGSGRANVGYGRLRSQLSSGHGKDQLHGELARLLPDQPAVDLRAHHLPLSTWRPRQPDGRILLAGDAASLINPLTGEGIFYAVRSGRIAGQIAGRAGATADPGRDYRRELDAALGRHLRHTTLLARLSAHRPALDAALAAASSRPALMDRLVEIGLADGLIPARLLPLAVASYLRRLASRR